MNQLDKTFSHQISSKDLVPSLPLSLSSTNIDIKDDTALDHPSPRHLHTSLVVGSKLYVLGGVNNQGPLKGNVRSITTQKIYTLDLETLKWARIDGKGYCQKKHGMASVSIKESIYLFGGSHNNSPTNNLLSYSPILGTWTWIDPVTPPPAPRQLSLAFSTHDSSFVIYGGIDLSS